MSQTYIKNKVTKVCMNNKIHCIIVAKNHIRYGNPVIKIKQYYALLSIKRIQPTKYVYNIKHTKYIVLKKNQSYKKTIENNEK